MDKKLFAVKYSGPFGFIKPWTAVRDSKTFSQQFLTPSIIEGIRQKLEVKTILRHKLTYTSISVQQEQTQARGWEKKTQQKLMIRNQSILERGVMVDPVLYLAFESQEDAIKASKQHICLCRNEDVLLPHAEVVEMHDSEFDEISGFELKFGKNEESFLVELKRRSRGVGAISAATFNRTVVELKRIWENIHRVIKLSFNRTVVELKPKKWGHTRGRWYAFNRTVVELKQDRD